MTRITRIEQLNKSVFICVHLWLNTGLLLRLLAHVDARVEDGGTGGGLGLHHDGHHFLFRATPGEAAHRAVGFHLFRVAKTTVIDASPTSIGHTIGGIKIFHFLLGFIRTKSDEGDFALHHPAENDTHRQWQL